MENFVGDDVANSYESYTWDYVRVSIFALRDMRMLQKVWQTGNPSDSI